MTGKERIYAVMKNNYPDTVPWVPFAGVHAGKLKAYTAREVSTEGAKLLESLLEVNRIYKPDGQPVMFDLQIEAEILGCELVWAEDSPPTVKTHPLADTDEIPDTIPAAADGRLALEIETMKQMKQRVGDATALYGLLCGPFTLASHLRGTNIFMDMIMNPGYVHRLLEYTNRVAKVLAGYFIDAGMDVIAAVDPLISQISPDHFAEFMEKPFTELFDCIRDRGAFSSFFVCGNATNNIEPMCRTKPDNISVDENVDLATAKKITDRYDVVLAGNIPLTSVMLFGNQQDNMKTVIDLMDSVSHDNLIISPGCDMPYATPIENTIAAEQAVHNTEATRTMVANYTKEDLVFEGELPDYPNLERPLIEVFTLDSATCAACTYMMASALDAKEHYGDRIDVVEYKYTVPENIARCGAMGVKQLPSIYINGELKYSSIIPSRDELFREIEGLLEK
ncbi:uroporphyrinogen decarboxylase family protein [Marispirochaeta aestuarii]|uniref:uroporphyrinogen decarboxylase family protein n=1 Tax=Marispirochaeta aestuarii TaxID=1963862 RepID=UPI0029C92F3A|nr:uroporphyrinogen decarboxylase family protein [Marispirochaeta aestuarii]